MLPSSTTMTSWERQRPSKLRKRAGKSSFRLSASLKTGTMTETSSGRREAFSTTARIFGSSLDAGKVADSDFITARKLANYLNRERRFRNRRDSGALGKRHSFDLRQLAFPRCISVPPLREILKKLRKNRRIPR